MTTIVRFTGTADFPLPSTALEFSDAEVDEATVVPFRDQVQSFSQEGDLTIYNIGPEHWVVTVMFVIESYDTLLRLSELRDHQAPLIVYPSYRDDPTRQFEVLWTNPNDLVEQLRRGYQVLGYAFTAVFREPLGEVCRPPEVTS